MGKILLPLSLLTCKRPRFTWLASRHANGPTKSWVQRECDGAAGGWWSWWPDEVGQLGLLAPKASCELGHTSRSLLKQNKSASEALIGSQTKQTIRFVSSIFCQIFNKLKFCLNKVLESRWLAWSNSGQGCSFGLVSLFRSKS